MPMMKDAKVLILSTNGFEQSELEVPRDRLQDAGATVRIAAPEGDTIRGWDGDDWGGTAEVDLALSDVTPSDYDALVLPGGQINPDLLRTNAEAIGLIKAVAAAGKPVAAICHAPWLLIEAGLAEGRRMTGFPSIRTDLGNAGAQVVDESVVSDGGLITSRNPDDLNDFVAKIIEEIEADGAAKAAA